MIPKTLHYIWLGKDKPELVGQCEHSFKNFLSDYEIIKWNESSIDFSCYNDTVMQFWNKMYDSGKYAFCADISRLFILERYGGIFVDADVEFIKPMNDEILNSNFLCRTTVSQRVDESTIWGCDQHNSLATGCINWCTYYLERYSESYGKLWRVGNLLESYFSLFGYNQRDHKNQKIFDYTIYSADYFNPKNFNSKKATLLNENTISIHHHLRSFIK